jgi:FHA domain/Restriction endonuclease
MSLAVVKRTVRPRANACSARFFRIIVLPTHLGPTSKMLCAVLTEERLNSSLIASRSTLAPQPTGRRPAAGLACLRSAPLPPVRALCEADCSALPTTMANCKACGCEIVSGEGVPSAFGIRCVACARKGVTLAGGWDQAALAQGRVDAKPEAWLLLSDGTSVLLQDTEVALGRSEASAVCVVGDQVSRRHAIIGWHDGSFVLRDAGSQNGTWLNERRVSSARLAEGDVVRIGRTLIRFTQHLPTGESLRPANRDLKLTEIDAHGQPGPDGTRTVDNAAATAKRLLDSQRARVNTFVQIAFTRGAQRDEYGDPDHEAFARETAKFLVKLAKLDGEWRFTERVTKAQILKLVASQRPEVREVSEEMRSYFEDRRLLWEILTSLQALVTSYRPALADGRGETPRRERARSLSGTEYEFYILGLLSAHPAVSSARRIGGSGDCGGDLLFVVGTKRIVAQAKRYSGKVGTDSIQEVYAAKANYTCDIAVVVTTSSFTSPARRLAAQLGVHLIARADSDSLQEFMQGILG